MLYLKLMNISFYYSQLKLKQEKKQQLNKKLQLVDSCVRVCQPSNSKNSLCDDGEARIGFHFYNTQKKRCESKKQSFRGR